MSDNFQVFVIELETLIPFDSIKVAPERLAQLQKSSTQDFALETLKNTFLTRWLEKREQCPVQIRDYWNCREEISLYNGILFKSQKVIVPKAMRPEMLLRIHSSRQEIASCPRKAKDMVSWPGMNSEIKAIVERCNLMKFPTGHEANLFTGRGKNYITLVDYFSDFVEVDELEDTTSHAVLKFLYNN